MSFQIEAPEELPCQVANGQVVKLIALVQTHKLFNVVVTFLDVVFVVCSYIFQSNLTDLGHSCNEVANFVLVDETGPVSIKLHKPIVELVFLVCVFSI